MASSSSFQSEDHFLCSICLDVFTDPISIPCGHNFCSSCISRYWGGKQQCRCPLCKEEFSNQLKLRVNTAFREVVEEFKKHHQERSRDASQFVLRPGQVPCDCCPDNKFRASKTCLVCLASYCELHLECHERVEALKRHVLTDPVLNLKDKICMKHNRLLEVFCRDDLTCICMLCTDHSDHNTVPLEKAFANKKSHVGRKKLAISSRRKAQRTKASEQPARKDDTALSNVASNQLQDPYIWFSHEGCVPTNSDPHHGFWYKLHVRHRVGWNLKVVIESVSGKSSFEHIYQNGPCTIRCHKGHRALSNDPVHLFLIKTPEGALVFSKHERELLLFHDQETDIVIYSLKGSRFIERIFFCFIPTTTKIDIQGLLKTVQKMKACCCSSISNCFIFFVCAFLCFILWMST